MTTLKQALRTLITHPYDRNAMRVVSHSLLAEVEKARAELRAELAAEAAKATSKVEAA